MKELLQIATIITICFSTVGAGAQQLLGGYINYRALGNDSYEITMILYNDCSANDLPVSFNMEMKDSCGQSTVFTVNAVPELSAIDVTPLYLSEISPCDALGAPHRLPVGIERFTYKQIINSSGTCGAELLFSFETCCRSNNINTTSNTNLGFYIDAMVKRTAVANNSSATVNDDPGYLAANIPFSLYNGFYDPDGDSLSFEIITPRINNVKDIDYKTGISATDPFYYSDPNSLYPDTTQVTITAVRINEYRNGDLIGYQTYDRSIIVFQQSTGILDPIAITVNIYPNPAKDILTVETEAGNFDKLTIFDITGKMIYLSNIEKGKATISVKDLPAGVYVIALNGEAGSISKKVIVE